MNTQGSAVRFLRNAENAKKLNGLVDDVREAVMDYQVRASRYRLLTHLTSTLVFPTAGRLYQHKGIDGELPIQPFIHAC